MFDFILNLNVADGPVLVTVYVLAALAFGYLLIKKLSWRWAITAAIALIAGYLLGYLTLWLFVSVLNVLGSPVNDATWLWVPLAFSGSLLAIANLWDSRWWRKLIAVLGILVFMLASALTINAAYALTPTIASILHIDTHADIETVKGTGPAVDPTEPLYQTWNPPADMPAHGQLGVLQPPIPTTESNFGARPANIYYPPAALVADAPRLPVMIFMMGQPGSPGQFVADWVDKYAVANKGLGPIVVIVDQLSNPAWNPLCLDSGSGNAESYVMKDVVPWVKNNLNVLQGRQYWTVGGYSNGGECSSYFGSKYPDTWGNILAISPDEFQGAETQADVLKNTFGGNQAAYDAAKPAAIMARNAPYTDTLAIFTAGEKDRDFSPGVIRLTDAARAAGMNTYFYSVPGADHGGNVIDASFQYAYSIMYPRLGLSAPATQ